ncbi:MAG: DNA repair protein RecO [Verrucomicrobia bacterium]|nr:DNA repair protein RecO [Verrucomicrobiota bacterium]
MFHKTSALALRIWPHSNTSLIVAWLTPDRGRVATLMKGALRPKSIFLGQCDLFYSCELIFYTRSHTDLFIAKEITPLNCRNFFRTDWRANCAASYWSHLILQTAVHQSPHDAAFRLSNTVLNQLEQSLRPALVLLWGELKLLDLLGFAPQLKVCCLCQRPLVDTPQGVAFAVEHGGAVCASCTARCASTPWRVRPDILAILKRLQETHEPGVTRSLVVSPNQYLELLRLLGLFLAFHLDTDPESRHLAFTLLAENLI